VSLEPSSHQIKMMTSPNGNLLESLPFMIPLGNHGNTVYILTIFRPDTRATIEQTKALGVDVKMITVRLSLTFPEDDWM
jgi:hypothetical protein